MSDIKINKINGKEFKEISSLEEYNLKLRWYDEQTNLIIKNKFKIFQNPIKYYNAFMDLIDECEGTGLFSKDFCDWQRKKLIDGIEDINLKKKVQKIIDKFKGKQ